MPCSATSSSGRYAVVSVTTAVSASQLTGRLLIRCLDRESRPPRIRLDGEDPGHRRERLPRLAPGARARRARRRAARCSPGAARTSATSTGSSSSARPATSPTAAPCAGRWTGVDRVFHVAGRTSLRPADREAVFAANLRGARVVFESALEAGRRARRAHVERRRDRGREAAGTADETTPFEIGHLGTRLRQLQARGRAARPSGSPPHGLPS